MTPQAGDRNTADFILLDELMASRELWIDRRDEATAVANHLLQSRAPIVVLHGPARTGKTELVRRWVMPIVSRQRPVLYRDSFRTGEATTRAEGDSIEFWDGRCLGDDAVEAECVEELSRLAVGESKAVKLVLIVSDDALGRLFQLSESVPHLLDDMREIAPIAVEALLQRLARTTARHGVRLSDAFVDALKRDIVRATNAATITPELVAVLAFELCRSVPRDGYLEEKQYDDMGRLAGMLEAHLRYLMAGLPEIDQQIAGVVLHEVVSGTVGQALDLAEIASRFDVPVDVPQRAVRWLEESRGILRKRDAGYDLVPPQLALAVQARVDGEAMAADRPRRILRQGVRHFLEGGVLLAPHAFAKVHAHRSTLKVGDEEAKLMLRSSLAHETPELAGATEHWLRRLAAPAARLDVLLEAGFDSCPDVRKRAVKYLSEFPLPEVRSQLHLLALRDTSESVRAQTVASLDRMKDDVLRDALIQELTDPKSPYRRQAIHALGIFKDETATKALAGIVGNPREEDAEARHRAIEVLGRQETTHAAEELLSVALHDEDTDDREGAVRALGTLKAEETLRFVVDRLRHPARRDKRSGPSVSARSVGVALGQSVLATLTALLGLVVHGVPLATIGRGRLALVVTLIEVVGVALRLLTPGSGAGSIVLASSLVIGWLAPLRILLLERREPRPQSGYRTYLSAVLFLAASVTVFLWVHGLACMLAKRARRGVALIGLQGLGTVLVLGSVVFADMFALHALVHSSSAITWLSKSLAVVGLLLFVTSYAAGVGSVLGDAFVLRSRRTRRDRLDAVYAGLLPNPVVTGIVMRALGSDSPEEARWSARVLRRFKDETREPLRSVWQSADAPRRRKLFPVMAKRPDASSTKFLLTAAWSLGWRTRLRGLWATPAILLSAWPKSLLAIVCLALYVQLALTAALYALWTTNPTALYNVLEGQSGLHVVWEPSVERRTKAVQTLEQLVGQRLDPAVSATAASRLASALALPAAADHPVIRDRTLQAIASVANGSEKKETLVGAVGELLASHDASRDAQSSAVDTLRRIGGANAAAWLWSFAESPVQNGRQAMQDRRKEIEARTSAIAALAHMEAGGLEPLRALAALKTSRTLDAELKAAADEAAASIDPLTWADYHVSAKEFATAIDEAQRVVAENSANHGRRQRARALLTRAYLERGSMALRTKEYDAAKADFDTAVATGVDAENANAALVLGLDLCVVFHEQRAPEAPRAYRDVYQLLLKLRGLGGDRALQEAVEANLVEASLTTGRYDDAYRSAQKLLAGRDQLEPATALSLRFLAYAALVLDRDASGAANAGRQLWSLYDSLPEGSGNGWSYYGTRSYIERADLPSGDKDALLGALDRIESPSRVDPPGAPGVD